MGHCGEFSFALWATTVNLVMRYGPLRRFWLRATAHCGGFCHTLWATAQNEAIQ
jgi:hypothetical protein